MDINGTFYDLSTMFAEGMLVKAQWVEGVPDPTMVLVLSLGGASGLDEYGKMDDRWGDIITQTADANGLDKNHLLVRLVANAYVRVEDELGECFVTGVGAHALVSESEPSADGMMHIYNSRDLIQAELTDEEKEILAAWAWLINGRSLNDAMEALGTISRGG